jgi:hypothetical protein
MPLQNIILMANGKTNHFSQQCLANRSDKNINAFVVYFKTTTFS